MSKRRPRADAAASKRKRILVVEDHPLLREGVAQWIQHDPELEVCGEASNAPEAFRSAMRLKPDLVLCDITLAGRSGLDVVKDLKAVVPKLPVVILSMHDEDLFALRAVRAGARGYVMKTAGGAEVISAIKQVLGGGTAFSPRIASQLVEEISLQSRGQPSPFAPLTDREFDVLRLLGEGKTNREIANLLHLSPKTVEVHRVSVRRKLKLRSTPELIRYAVTFTAASTESPP